MQSHIVSGPLYRDTYRIVTLLVIHRTNGQQQYSGRLWRLNDAQLVLRKYPPHHYTTTTSLNCWDKAGWIHAFMFFYAKFWPYHLNVAAELETHQNRQHFSNLLLSNFGESVEIVASVSCSYLTGAAPGVVFCSCIPSASGFDVLCVQRWYSAYLGCNERLFELLLSFYHL